MQSRARIGITLLAVALAGGLALGFYPQAVGVDLVVATKGSLQVTVEEEGKTRVRDRYVISAPVTGMARRIDLSVGDVLKAGQVVAIIEPARSSAARTTGTTLRMCARDASSGTTPPYFAWTSCCEATTSDRTRQPSSTTAAAVSSHELSSPSTLISWAR